MYAPITEVKVALDTCPDLTGLAGAQGVSQDHMVKDEEYLGVPLPIKRPSSLHS